MSKVTVYLDVDERYPDHHFSDERMGDPVEVEAATAGTVASGDR